MSHQATLYRNREFAHRMVDSAPVGSVMEIKPPRRTIPQNDRLWPILTRISGAKPEGRVLTPDQWKCVFMDALGVKAVWVPSLDGESVVNTGFRSSKLTKDQFSDLFAVIEEYAARQGIELEEPHPAAPGNQGE